MIQQANADAALPTAGAALPTADRAPRYVRPHGPRFLVRESAHLRESANHGKSANHRESANHQESANYGKSAPHSGLSDKWPALPQTTPSDPDPADELTEIGERIAALAASINAAEFEMLTLIAEFDRRKGWECDGFGSCAEWLAWRTGLRPGSARERVRAARALEELPQTAASMAKGELSFAKVRALTRVATPESEPALLELAQAGSAANLERTIRSWRHLTDKQELGLENARHAWRRLTTYVDDDGMVVVKGRLTPEVGTLLMQALAAAEDCLFRKASTPGRSPEPETERATSHANRKADALGLLAERALAAGFRGDGEEPQETKPTGATEPREQSPSHRGPRRSGSKAERYQVVVHVGAGVLEQPETGKGANPADIHIAGAGQSPTQRRDDQSTIGGIRVSAETSRRMCCDASIVVMRYGQNGEPVSVGRKTRTIPPALRRALDARDRRCRFPGCECRFTDAHHIKHWAEGGETSLHNLILLCSRHHRAVHEGGIRVVRGRHGKVAFFLPSGRVLFESPGDQPKPTPMLDADWESDPAVHVWQQGGARHKRDRLIPWKVQAAAMESLG